MNTFQCLFPEQHLLAFTKTLSSWYLHLCLANQHPHHTRQHVLHSISMPSHFFRHIGQSRVTYTAKEVKHVLASYHHKLQLNHINIYPHKLYLKFQNILKTQLECCRVLLLNKSKVLLSL